MEEQNQTPTPNTQAAEDAARTPEAGADEVVRLTQQVAELEAKAKEHFDMFLRATAEGETVLSPSELLRAVWFWAGVGWSFHVTAKQWRSRRFTV